MESREGGGWRVEGGDGPALLLGPHPTGLRPRFLRGQELPSNPGPGWVQVGARAAVGCGRPGRATPGGAGSGPHHRRLSLRCCLCLCRRRRCCCCWHRSSSAPRARVGRRPPTPPLKVRLFPLSYTLSSWHPLFSSVLITTTAREHSRAGLAAPTLLLLDLFAVTPTIAQHPIRVSLAHMTDYTRPPL